MRPRSRVTSFLLFVLAATVVTSAATLYRRVRSGQNAPAQNPKPRGTKDWEGQDFETQFPTVDLESPEPTDPDKRIKRQSKGKRYDGVHLVSGQSSQTVNESVLDNHWQERVAALPVAESNIIVVGEALSSDAYLSNDKSGVYTEFNVRVSETIKSDDPTLVPGSVICVDRPGGFVRYPDGHKILYRIFGLNMLRPNSRYLLFLKNDDQGLNYRVLTGYEITTNTVSPLDVGRQFDTYKGMDKTSFLRVVHEATAQNP